MLSHLGRFKFLTATAWAAGALFASGCNDNGDPPDHDACKTDVRGTFECGVGQKGMQEQECVEGEWYFTTRCEDSDGNVVPPSDDDVPPLDNAPPCDDNSTRDFACGNDRDGVQNQQCVDGVWYSTELCHDKDGNPVADAPHDDFPPIDDRFTRPTDPSACQELKNADVGGGKTLPEATCYIIKENIRLKDGTLTIEPNVTLFVEHDRYIEISDGGRLQAEGAANKEIWFLGTSHERGFWGGIRFHETLNGQNYIKHARIQHAGSSRYVSNRERSRAGILTWRESNLDVEHVRVEQTKGFGISLHSKATNTLDHITFKDNEHALVLNTNHLGGLSENLTFDNNDSDTVEVTGNPSDIGGVVKDDATWRALDLPYLLTHSLNLRAHIEVQPGVHFRIKPGVLLTVDAPDGRLYADAAGAETIVFEGEENGLSGQWVGLLFNSKSNDNRLRNVRISHAGSTNAIYYTDPAAITLNEAAHIDIADLDIDYSGGGGIATYSDGTIADCSDLNFSNNQGDDFSGSISGPQDCL